MNPELIGVVEIHDDNHCAGYIRCQHNGRIVLISAADCPDGRLLEDGTRVRFRLTRLGTVAGLAEVRPGRAQGNRQ